MKYVQCRNCGFWIIDKEKNCPDCGCKYPVKKKRKLMVFLFPAFILVSFFLFYLIVILVPSYKLIPLLFGILLGVSFVAFLLIGNFIDILVFKNDRFTKKNLHIDEENINKRISNIKERILKIKNVRKKAKAGKESAKQKSMLVLLDNARTLLEKYKNRYEVELWNIRILRWKNSLEPIEFEWQKADYDGCNKKLEELQAAINKADEILKTYTADPLASIEEAGKIIKNLKENIDICYKFYEGITAREAKLAINNVSPLDDKSKDLKTRSNEKTYSNLFHSRSDVTSFITAFEELENEFDRIQAEDELSTDI